MRVQRSRRGFYYRCDDCKHTINHGTETPRTIADRLRALKSEPVLLQFDAG